MDGAALILFLTQIGLVVAVPLFAAWALRRLTPSALVVELLCGVVLGPTIFGRFAPGLHLLVFPNVASATQAREAVTEFGLLLFVFMAGLEVETSSLRKRARTLAWTSGLSIAVPFGLGAGAVLLWPALWGAAAPENRTLLALFVATTFSISALPVISRILMDHGLIRTELGVLIMSSATVDDILGWGLFALILTNFGHDGGRSLGASLVSVLAVFALALNLSNRRIQRAVRWLNLPRETLLLKLTFLVVLATAVFSQAIGTHATLGAFLAGAALSRIPEARRFAHESFDRITAGVFAPLYFVSIGLHADFAANFDVVLVGLVLTLACAGKITGSYFGSRLGGANPRDSLIVAFGLNARGAMGIILATIAHDGGLIEQRLFVALIVMALATSVLASFGIRRLTGQPTDGTITVKHAGTSGRGPQADLIGA